MGESRSPRRRWLLTLLLALAPLAFVATGGLDAARRLGRGGPVHPTSGGDAAWSDHDEDVEDGGMTVEPIDPAQRAAIERARRVAAEDAARQVRDRIARRAGGGGGAGASREPHQYHWAARPAAAAGDPAPSSADAGGGGTESSARGGTHDDDGAPHPSPVGPGRGAPIAQAEPGAVHFDWDYTVGGHTYHCVTTVTIDAGDALRRPAQVTTSDDHGHVLVSYAGTAFVDANGQLEVDARNSPVSGPWAGSWSPDSFAVDEYGAVRTLDDYNRGGGGWVTSAGT